MKIGVLALQGSFREHVTMLKKCNVEPVEVRKPEDLDNIYGLIIPGGESTAIGKLMRESDLDREIIRKYELGMPIYGTCAGAILLAKDVVGEKQPNLGLMNISIKRNEYGRQVDSFETNLNISGFEKPFKCIFIRAPVINSFYNGAKIMAEFKNKPVMMQQDNILISTFHPELTDDIRIHKHFIDMIKKGAE
ncbi:pyridoxal 5'-phosphate synthase glutaminase subunit PdxT [Candidatus Woesearchaeota archaeon]|nr:pyridoxal 5'-phosphate synthase glutaminase subunit PdxT [Candidatus Woesearchaeota archaeon]